MFKKSPRTLRVLLSIFFIFGLLEVFFTPGTPVFPLLKLVLATFMIWKALSGKESAAKVIAIYLLIAAVLHTYLIIQMTAEEGLIALIEFWLVALEVFTAAYIFFSRSVREFYESIPQYQR